jgi:hypothetical protein
MKWLSVRIEAINQALNGVREERARLHVCWESGNSGSAQTPFQETARQSQSRIARPARRVDMRCHNTRG